MSVDWRALFDEARIAYKDRGRNCSRGNVNICCPFCRDDVSYHLAVSEADGKYYCFRNPEHAGASPLRMLVALGLSRIDVTKLLNDHDTAVTIERAALPKADRRAWDRFEPAALSQDAMDYMIQRGFDTPHATAAFFDLRVAPFGKWAKRLLIPLYDGASGAISWTGRALRSEAEPKYLAHECEELPRMLAGKISGGALIVVEGPLDALKLNAALHRFTTISAVAMVGKALTHGRLLRLAEATLNHIYLCLDSDVPISQCARMQRELTHACRTNVERLKLPAGAKDAAELSEPEIRDWLMGARVI